MGIIKHRICSRCRALKPAGRPLPHCRGGNGPPSATRRLRGGGAVVDSKNIVCHVNSSACRVYVTSFYSTTSISFYKSFYTFTVLMYFLQLHFRGHFRVHFCTSTPTFICGRTATFLFYTYTHLWTCSSLYSATATFVRPFSCTFSYIHVYIHLWTHSGLYIRLWLPHLYILHIVPASMSTPVCVAFTLRFSVPSLALFSRWQRVHGYTSLIRPRLHSSLHSTSTFSEHFRDSSILHHKHFCKLLRVLNTAICCG